MVHHFSEYWPYLLRGIPVTLRIAGLAMVVAIPSALILAVARNSVWQLLRWPAGLIVEVFRGTSAVVQLFWAFYALPLLGLHLAPMTAAVFVLGLNEGSYFSETVRAALASVPEAQQDAARALGYSPVYRFFRFILPQALPVIVPPFGNSMINMVKFTSLVSLVTLQDTTFRASQINSTIGASTSAYGVTLLIYFAISIVLSAIARGLEVLVRIEPVQGRPRRLGGSLAHPLRGISGLALSPPIELGSGADEQADRL